MSILLLCFLLILNTPKSCQFAEFVSFFFCLQSKYCNKLTFKAWQTLMFIARLHQTIYLADKLSKDNTITHKYTPYRPFFSTVITPPASDRMRYFNLRRCVCVSQWVGGPPSGSQKEGNEATHTQLHLLNRFSLLPRWRGASVEENAMEKLTY